MNITEAVHKLISEWPMVRWGLKEGLINVSALSRKLEEPVFKMVGKKPSREAILVAIYRFQDSVSPSEEIKNIVKKSYISIESDIVTTNYEVKNALATIKGLNNTVSILRKKDLGGATSYTDNLAILRIMLDDSSLEVPGVIEYFTFILASNGINILEMESANTELLFIIKEDSAPRAFEIISKAIK